MMQLWILRPKEGLSRLDNPWNPWYDKAFGFVIRAESEEEARKLAHDNAWKENDPEFLGEKTSKTDSPWLDPNYSTCDSLLADGNAGVLIEDVHRA